MPLPNPDYLTNEYPYFTEEIEPSVEIEDVGGVKKVFIWRHLSSADKNTIHELIMQYANKNSVIESAALPIPATSGWQVVNFGGTVIGGNATGLANDTTVYVASVNVDGTDYPISVVGSAAQTFTTLVSEIQTDLGAAATVTIDTNGNIDITSSVTGNASSVNITDINLFNSCVGFVGMLVPRHGATGFREVLELNNRVLNGASSNTFWNVYVGTIRECNPTLNTSMGPIDQNRIYYDYVAGVWKFAHDHSVVP